MIATITREQRDDIRHALQAAAYHKAEMWDALRKIEVLLETEVESDNEIVDFIASEISIPPEYPKLNDETLDDFLRSLA